MGWIYRVFCMLFSNQSLLTVDKAVTLTVILTFSRQCNVLYEKDKLSTQLRLACLQKQKNRVYYTGLKFSFFKIPIKIRIKVRHNEFLRKRNIQIKNKIGLGFTIWINFRIKINMWISFRIKINFWSLGLRFIFGSISGLRLIFG